MIDPILSLAFSMHSNKGVYALLLGSGVSRSAGIPTGWEIVLELIRKLAHLQGADCEPDPAAWYQTQYGRAPDYSELLNKIAQSPSERNQILKGYFEPTEEEYEQGLKKPTEAHKAIAELVKNGYIRVILTTNFDRLMEKSLEAVGMSLKVIDTTDAIKGMIPLTHTDCSIIKVHGDYLDTRIRNTPEELEQYDEELDHLLDQIFDEYGLVVCGWSGDWDKALRNAIERCPNRRFTTFWAARREPEGTALQLFNQRSGSFIKIRDADSFFQDLGEKVSALKELSKPHPLSAKVAVASLKKYLVDERYKIRLHDLVIQETENLHNKLSYENIPLHFPLNPKERVNIYESLMEILLSIVATGCFWGLEKHEHLWTNSLERIGDVPDFIGMSGQPNTLFRFYPVLLLLYAGGIAAIAANQYKNFAALTRAKVMVQKSEEPLILHINAITMKRTPIGSLLPEGRMYAPVSDHLFEVLREPLRELLPQDVQYQKCFDKFEYLLALTYGDVLAKRGKNFVMPLGRFGWDSEILSEVKTEFSESSTILLLLKAGLFDGSGERFQDIKNASEKLISEHDGLL
jgi:SIR2-like domain